MCGIVGYIGHQMAYPYLIQGLSKLEYRGYDSAGLALHLGDHISIYKKSGKVAVLESITSDLGLHSHMGIGHTRWATHGIPSDQNAHPHLSQSGKLALVHNGIIENYAALKEELIDKGYSFRSDTDSEVLLNLIEDILLSSNSSLEEAIRNAQQRIVGSYAILVLSTLEPDRLYALRKGSPLVIGIGTDEYYIGSDTTPILGYSNKIIYLNDNELAILGKGDLVIKNMENLFLTPSIQHINIKISAIERDGYPHFMLKEIMEQPTTINHTLQDRLNPHSGHIVLSGLEVVKQQVLKAKRILIVACGTSWHAALLAEYWIETICRIPVEVEYASEFRYRNPIIDEQDFIIAISQSGETADTLVALENAKQKGATLFSIVNVVGSSIARISDAGVYTHAGPEIGVASTKAFTAQLSTLLLFSLQLAKLHNSIPDTQQLVLAQQLLQIPSQIQHILDTELDNIQRIAHKYSEASDFLFLGRGYQFPIALEGALKLKEISYIHAEGYPAAEMKHGPIALVDENLPVVFLANQDHLRDKLISNIQEIRARQGQIISVITEGDTDIAGLSHDYISIPPCHEIVAPLLTVIPLQLLAYFIGTARNIDVDKPRNLAKSVTVE